MVWLLTLLLAGAAGGPVTPIVPVPEPAAAPRSMNESADAPSVTAMLLADTRRIRPANERIKKLLADGVRRSHTFSSLVAQIHATDVIVYVEPTFALPSDMAGRILLQVVAGKQRYLRMQVRATLAGDQLIAVMAHELRHALEVAEAPAVVDDAGMIALYKRIGHSRAGKHAFDTQAAVLAGRIVADELVG